MILTKKTRGIIFKMTVILFVLLGLLFGCEPHFSKVAYIEEEGVHPANMLQSTGAMMDVINGELFMCVFSEANKIIAADAEGNVRTVADLPQNFLAETMYDGYFYYSLTNDQNGRYYDLYCCDLATGETKFLADRNSTFYDPAFFGSGNEIFFPSDNDRSEFLVVQGGSCSELLHMEQEYIVGDRTYFVNSEDELVYEDKSGKTVLVMELYFTTELIRWGDGLLIHSGYPDCPLTYLSVDGTLTDLFVSETFVLNSAFNYHEDQAFFSLRRYQAGPKNKGLAYYENDTISGTYRINLEDLSTTKISDDFYSSIYIFNGKNLYCVDEDGNIVMTDFDGNVIQTIMER